MQSILYHVADLLSEDRISLSALAKREKVGRRTVLSWVTDGVDGIKLEAFRIGKAWYTTQQSYVRWVALQNPQWDEPPPPQLTGRQKRRQKMLGNVLKELGIDTTGPNDA
jgi:hypothetical protein